MVKPSTVSGCPLVAVGSIAAESQFFFPKRKFCDLQILGHKTQGCKKYVSKNLLYHISFILVPHINLVNNHVCFYIKRCGVLFCLNETVLVTHVTSGPFGGTRRRLTRRLLALPESPACCARRSSRWHLLSVTEQTGSTASALRVLVVKSPVGRGRGEARDGTRFAHAASAMGVRARGGQRPGRWPRAAPGAPVPSAGGWPQDTRARQDGGPAPTPTLTPAQGQGGTRAGTPCPAEEALQAEPVPPWPSGAA